jgi:CheY-like chemotaxis protein
MLETAGIKAEVHIAKDGDQATRFFDEADQNDSAPSPALVILDINLPKKRGIEVLRHLKQSRRCRRAAVIVASTSNLPQDREAAVQGGAVAYFHKSSEYEEFLKLADLIREWFPRT